MLSDTAPFVLQGGDDPYFTDERMTELIRRIKENHPDCAITPVHRGRGRRRATGSSGKRERTDICFVMRRRTKPITAVCHPQEMSLSHRMKCLYDLKELGYQVGAGFMVGSPGQTLVNIADDLLFLHRLQPEMVGIGSPSFRTMIPRYAGEKAGSVDMTIFLLSVIRILLPKVLLPATTALGTMDPFGREKGLLAGANVVMPNLSPEKKQKRITVFTIIKSVPERKRRRVSPLSEKKWNPWGVRL